MMGGKRQRPGSASASASAAPASVDPLSLNRLTISRMAATSDLTEEQQQPCSTGATGIDQDDTICADPTHHHSFQSASAILAFAGIRSCGMCGGRLGGIFGGGGTVVPTRTASSPSTGATTERSGGKVVRCLACGIYVHRSCAFRNYSVHCALLAREGTDPGCNICSVNGPAINALDKKLGLCTIGDPVEDYEEAVVLSEESEEAQCDEDSVTEIIAENDGGGDGSMGGQATESFFSRLGWVSRQSSSIDDAVVVEPPLNENNDVENGEEAESDIVNIDQRDKSDKVEPDANGSLSDDEDAMWTEAGPPTHWATDGEAENKLRGIASSSSTQSEMEEKIQEDGDPIVPSAQPFASVARALHENVLPLFLGKQQDQQQYNNKDDMSQVTSELPQQEENDTGNSDYAEYNGEDESKKVGATNTEADAAKDSSPSEEQVAGILNELDPKAPPPPPPPPPSTFQTTLEVVRTTRRTRSNMGVASVAGSIVGGVAGLALAGPAGAVVLSKVCQTAGVLSVLLDGTMSVGVLVAGAAAAKFAAEQVAQGGNRMLALGGGEKGSRAVMLVRPTVVVDPVWGEYCDDAKRSHPKVLASSKRSITGAGFLAHHQAKVADKAKERRNEVDADIVNSAEYEIATEDKVVLVVSRSLNDRLSLPGHVYNKLIQEFKDRVEKRKVDNNNTEVKGPKQNNDEDTKTTGEEETIFSKERRRDAHGIIKYVTATLLEVRPGLGATARLTDLTASAVDGLVFGEIYGSVFEEICDETEAKDVALMTKMYEFEVEHQSKRKVCMEVADGEHFGDCMVFPISDDNISVKALEALLSLPDAHSPVDKLDLCVQFLEAISVHFDHTAGGGKAVSADYLLKMVCEHIIVAKVPRLNAELAFLEEFARDEHLLRGKEGYSLVTLQASLHFLNASTDFNADIFKDEY